MATTFDPARHCGAETHPLNGATPCLHGKGWGTDHPGAGHCKMHGGTSPNGAKHARREAAQQALAKLGVAIETDPQTALLGQVWEAMGNVAFLRGRVQELEQAVSGRDHNGDGKPHVLVVMYGEERDRLAKICKLAIDAGIAERAIAIAEQQADAIVAVINRVLDSLALDPDAREGAQKVAADALREFADFEVVATGKPRVAA